MKKYLSGMLACFTAGLVMGSVFGGEAGVKSGGGFHSVGELTGFGSVGQPFETTTSVIGSDKNYVGLIYVLFGFPLDSGADSNEDGIPDWWYQAHGFDAHGPSVAEIDTNSNGQTNRQDFVSGVNPIGPNGGFQPLSTVERDGETLRLRWEGVGERVYKIYMSTNLATPPSEWTAIGTVPTALSGPAMLELASDFDETVAFFYLTVELP